MYSIPPEQYLIQKNDSFCTVALGIMTLHLGDNVLVLGAAFMRGFLIVRDNEQGLTGFGLV